MRFFADLEFSERGNAFPLDLISVGIVAEDGREYYAISTNFDHETVNPWVRENVLVHLPPRTDPAWKSRATIAQDLIVFCGERPEIWGYYSDYDWVIIAQLFGTMIDLPKSWPMWCRDLKQLVVSIGDPLLPTDESVRRPHHALDDARQIRDNYAWVQEKIAEMTDVHLAFVFRTHIYGRPPNFRG